MLTIVEYTYPANLSFECNRCGLCCGDTAQKTRHILLLDSEAQGISAAIHLPIAEFARQVPDKTPYNYEMKKPADGKCFFLKNKQCCIYTHRPLICRFYPFELTFSQDRGTYIFGFTVECPGIGKGKTQSKADFEELFRLAQVRLG